MENTVRENAHALSVRFSKIAYGYQDIGRVTEVVKALHLAFSEDAAKFQLHPDGGGSFSLDLTPEKTSRQENAAADLFTVKNGAFCEEREWRILAFNSPDRLGDALKFRVSQSQVSPYVCMPFPPDAIVGVTLGPTNPNSREMVEAALRRYKIRASVAKSSASYRTGK